MDEMIKTTYRTPKGLKEAVKDKAKRKGFTVTQVLNALQQIWVDGGIEFDIVKTEVKSE